MTSFRDALSVAWQDLRTPEDFAGRPFAAVANQWGHWALGLASVALWCAISVTYFGELPYKWQMALALPAAYFIGWERLVQDNTGRDAGIDTAFYSWGVWSPLLVLTEITHDPFIDVNFNEKAVYLVVVVLVVALILHGYRMARLPLPASVTIRGK